MTGQWEGNAGGRIDGERHGLSQAEVKNHTAGRGCVRVRGFYLGGGGRRKRGGDPFLTLQHPERSQWRPNFGTERDGPGSH